MNPSGDVCCLHKSGSGTITPEVLTQLLSLVASKVTAVSAVFKKFLANENLESGMSVLREESLLA